MKKREDNVFQGRPAGNSAGALPMREARDHRSPDDPQTDSMPPEPRIGIFWVIEGKGQERRQIVSFSMPVSRCAAIDQFSDYPHGHVHLWPLVQRQHPKLRGYDYCEIPRGRVTYDQHIDKFQLLLPRRQSRQRGLVALLLRTFALPRERTDVRADDHYDPPCEEGH